MELSSVLPAESNPIVIDRLSDDVSYGGRFSTSSGNRSVRLGEFLPADIRGRNAAFRFAAAVLQVAVDAFYGRRGNLRDRICKHRGQLAAGWADPGQVDLFTSPLLLGQMESPVIGRGFLLGDMRLTHGKASGPPADCGVSEFEWPNRIHEISAARRHATSNDAGRGARGDELGVRELPVIISFPRSAVLGRISEANQGLSFRTSSMSGMISSGLLSPRAFFQRPVDSLPMMKILE